MEVKSGACGMKTNYMETMELPKVKVRASRKSPKNMVIYGPPKIGKTTVLSQLDNCLIIDLEDGSDMVDALKVKANSLADLPSLGIEIMNQGRPYKYVAIDNISKLEDWWDLPATALYHKTTMGTHFDVTIAG